MSRAYGGVLSALEIVYELYPITSKPSIGHDDHRQEPFAVDANTTVSTTDNEGLMSGKRYREKEVVTAIYEKKRKVLAVVEQEVEL